MRVIVDQDACISSGQCVLAEPAVFDQTDDGVVVLLDECPPAELHDAVREAESLCPAQAITLTDS
ncbi:MAG TPA: ferredoxin [Solirubrobacteraceae bacterium]|jgi:ferredoxin